MSDAYGATIAKRRLSRRLTELRLASGFTANQVCDRLNWGRGKVGRYEANAWVRPEMSDLRDLLRLYGADEETSSEIEELAQRARVRAWWRDYSDVFDNEYPGYENDAVRIRAYAPLMIPGLLQTPAYMEAHMRLTTRPSTWRNRVVGARLRRQEILTRKPSTAPEYVAILTEAALQYRWGTAAERRDQLEHLVEMSRLPNVEIRLLRFVDGPHPGMCGPINIFDFPDGEPPMAYIETDFALQEVAKEDEVKALVEIFERARAVALEPPATTAYLKQEAEKLE